MILKQYYLGCLAHASYLIADTGSKTGIVVDPQRDIDQYLKDAADHGVEIRHVFLTHFHADFLAGHLELRDRTGAEIRLGARAEAEYAFTPMRDRDRLDFGKVRLEVLETPGHTPEGISILVFDLEKDTDIPHAVLTGDTLFIGDVGRPDLFASVGVTAAELGRMLYTSLHDKLLPLPDETLVYPAHGAGSMCGKNLSSDTVSTIGDQRRFNYALQPMSCEEFVNLVASNQPDAPAYFSYDAMLNRKERDTLDHSLERSLKPLPLDEVLRLRNAGAQMLDVRDAAEFAGAHMEGSVNIGLGGKYATWAGSLLDKDRAIVIVAEPGQEEEAAVRLGRIGFDQVAGFLDGGMMVLEKRPDLVKQIGWITAGELKQQVAGGETPVILDVRAAGERESGGIPDSLHIPLIHLSKRLKEVPRDRPVVIHCASGYRSSAAASILERHGFTNAVDLVGGYAAWEVAGKSSSTS
jgi:glyoxylase-like metal-dependent hydrolase (beta-lactamase superfamily II)/rhodanese-related sulfurtransferase